MSNNLGPLRIFSACLLILNLGLLTSCATKIHRAIEQVEVGMDKSQAVELLGAPQRTQRQQGQDLWTYNYLHNGQPMITILTFSQGRVSGIQSLQRSDLEAQRRLEQSQSLEEFEKEAQRLSPEERSRLLKNQPSQQPLDDHEGAE